MNKMLSVTADADVAVRLQNLRKVYKLYRKPTYRLRDILGLLPHDKRYFDEHVALGGVTLDIKRGEKVAIIGRNGAGKSTLLRLITRVIEPTSGSLEVRGDAQALLSLGTGFHPELTGRQNVLAYLANFGIVGAEAERMLREAIDFSELEEYIDQPTKTYSTGMNMRLMFAASTMFAPDLLVIDEVLGVGDAYFQGKSFERIREICAGAGTTLLLVTHDIYTASTLCERMIWIDHGTVILDADSSTVLKAYDSSVRQQEEARLRKKALLRFEDMERQNAGVQKSKSLSGTERHPLIIELRSPTNSPSASPVAIGKIALLDNDREVAAVALRAGATEIGSIIDDSGSWGAETIWNGQEARQMQNFGSALHKVGVCFSLPSEIMKQADGLTLVIESGADIAYPLEAWRIDPDLKARRLGTVEHRPSEWTTTCLSLAGEAEHALAAARAATSSAEEAVGSGRVTVTSLRLFDQNGQEAFHLKHGERAEISLQCRINDPNLREHCDIVLAFRRNGVDDVFRLYCNTILFDGQTDDSLEVRAMLDALPLAQGEYWITALIATENYYRKRPSTFFSINPDVYWAGRNVLEFKVETDDLVAQGTVVVGTAFWTAHNQVKS